MEINSGVAYLAGSTLLGIGAYWLRARTDVWRLTKTGEVAAVNTPFNVLREILANRDRENVEQRAQMNLIITNHLEHDAADRQGVAKAMLELANSQRELISMIREDRVAQVKREEKLNETLTDIRVDIGRSHSHQRAGDA